MVHRSIKTERSKQTGSVKAITIESPDATDEALLPEFADEVRASMFDGEESLELNLGRVCESDTRLIAVLIHGLSCARRCERRVRLESSQSVTAWLELCRVLHLFAVKGSNDKDLNRKQDS